MKTEKLGLTALVTGGADRLGKEIAFKLAELGYNIAIHYLNSENKARKTASEIEKLDVSCKIYPADFMKNNEVTQLIPTVLKDFKTIDILVNNASIFEKATSLETGSDLLERQFQINFKAPYILSKEFAAHCKTGLILNMLDTRVDSHDPGYSAYALSKKSLRDFTLMAAKEFAPNIRVNAICPGIILPPSDEPDKDLSKILEKVPLARKGEVEEIIMGVEYLVKNEYVTGQLLFIDGGQSL